MKKLNYSIFGILFLLTSSLIFNTSCSSDNTEVDPLTENPVIESSLTDEEQSDLLTLREEEKLARDVYDYTYTKYGLPISDNISKSEETHMAKVLAIMNTYNLADNTSQVVGVFNDEALQAIYTSLIAKVNISLLDALIVGATVEDLDIKDIEDLKLKTSKEDILVMYNLLAAGSRNHLRSYYSLILSNGGSYTPQYISQSDFDAIINE